MAKNSFVLYTDYLDQVELLSMEQRGQLFTAIMCYASEKSVPQLDGMVAMAFSFIKAQIDRDNEKYGATLEARREAGKKGGRPKKPEKANGFEEKAKKANGFSEKQTKAKKPDNDNVYVDDNDNVNDDDILKTSCAETNQFAPTPVVKIPLNDGSEYGVSEKEYQYYKGIYPAVDVMSELRKMAGWCFGNPKNRKTRRGIGKFINGWLSRAQDKAPKGQRGFYDDMRKWVDEHEPPGIWDDSGSD